ncbi:MAG: TonB-dependent receptor [Myxococcota bacterium]
MTVALVLSGAAFASDGEGALPRDGEWVVGQHEMVELRDYTAADTLRRMPGVHVEGGRRVLLRGLPSRGTLALLNGSPLPSFDAFQRAVPLHLIPTAALSEVGVRHAYRADQFAGFGMGSIDLRTAKVPERGFVAGLLLGGGNLRSVFRMGLDHQGGLDAIGLAGSRDLPAAVAEANAANGDLAGLPPERRDRLARRFTNLWNPDDHRLPPDGGVMLTAGTGVDLPGQGRFGVVGGLVARQAWRRQARVQRMFSLNLAAPEPLVARNVLEEARTDHDVDLGGLITARATWPNHTVSASTLAVHLAQDRTQRTEGVISRADDVYLRDTLLSWVSGTLLAEQWSTSHRFGGLVVDGRAMVGRARRFEPDRRNYAYQDFLPYESDDPNFFLFRGFTNRTWGTVEDRFASYGIDAALVALDPTTRDLGLLVKAGVAGHRLRRTADNRIYSWSVADERGGDFRETNPEILFDPAQTGPDGWLDFTDFSSSIGDVVASEEVLSGYGLLDFRFGDVVRLVGGVRYERGRLAVDRTTDPDSPVDATRIEGGGCAQEIGCDLFPSVSAEVRASETVNIRASWGRSTTRPGLTELTDWGVVDTDSGESYTGNADLPVSAVEGFDAHVDIALAESAALTAGAFVRRVPRPIERSAPLVGGFEADATLIGGFPSRVRGLELGGRVRHDALYAIGHVVVLDTAVDTGIDTRSPERRPLDGQVTHTVDLRVGVQPGRHDLALILDAVGPRTHRLGVVGLPRIVQRAIPQLDAMWTFTALQQERRFVEIQVRGVNLLDPAHRWTQTFEDVESGRVSEGVWREFRRGASVFAAVTVGVR